METIVRHEYFKLEARRVGNIEDPHKWQSHLFEEFTRGLVPKNIVLPTGSGKTSILWIWMLAHDWMTREGQSPKLPRRLVWVVNRRVVVDQATDEACKIARCFPDDQVVVSTLRGELADNRMWSEDPSRLAIIVGTVDMIGSRLLFSGYGDGPYFRPQHAGLLGHDALIVNDEAHLTPAFAKLIQSTKRLQGPQSNFHFLWLSATPRSNENRWPPNLNADLAQNSPLRARYLAPKSLSLTEVDSKKLDSTLIAKALGEGGPRRIVFVEEPEKAKELFDRINKNHPGRTLLLTGTMRGKERDALASDPVFQEFRAKERPTERCWLVATSAGEVGVDITSEVLITTLASGDHLVQRFGRLNRFGDPDGGAAHVVYVPPKDKDELLLRTLAYLKTLKDVSCKTVDENPPAAAGCIEPEPAIPRLDERVVSLWAMTTERHSKVRPEVEPWLHGKPERDFGETYFAWREDIHWLANQDIAETDLKEVFRRHPLFASEKLREPTFRAAEKLKALADGHPNARVILIDSVGGVSIESLAEIADPRKLRYATVVLPAAPTDGHSVGTLTKGMLETDAAKGEPANDVADLDTEPARARYLVEQVDGSWRKRKIGEFNTEEIPGPDVVDGYPVPIPNMDEDGPPTRFLVYWRAQTARTETQRVELDAHVREVCKAVRQLATALTPGMAPAFERAAELHDEGKKHNIWQKYAWGRSTPQPNVILGKPQGKTHWSLLAGFRHEFASLVHARKMLSDFDEPTQDLILHLIASHHGRARPHFRRNEWLKDHLPFSGEVALEVVQRFARLQERFGWWGLAYLEAVFKAGDVMASQGKEEQIDAE
jgi:CRISPR-associated endonuclease/helicase Cas3